MPVPKSARLDKTGIVQIAASLGVSPSTVSRALRPETAHLVQKDRRKQILDLAEKQHFSPNPGARMLRKGVNANLTMVVPLDETSSSPNSTAVLAGQRIGRNDVGCRGGGRCGGDGGDRGGEHRRP